MAIEVGLHRGEAAATVTFPAEGSWLHQSGVTAGQRGRSQR